MKKKIAAIAATVAFGVALAGCGSTAPKATDIAVDNEPTAQEVFTQNSALTQTMCDAIDELTNQGWTSTEVIQELKVRGMADSDFYVKELLQWCYNN